MTALSERATMVTTPSTLLVRSSPLTPIYSAVSKTLYDRVRFTVRYPCDDMLVPIFNMPLAGCLQQHVRR